MKALISIKGAPALPDEEIEGFELMTDGEYMQRNGVSTFSYVEGEMTGIGGLLTTFKVEPDRVVLRRGDGGGGDGGDMIFSEDRKHHFIYETPFGSYTMGIDTHSIKKNMREDGGSLEIRYDIELDNVAVSRNLFQIDIRAQ